MPIPSVIEASPAGLMSLMVVNGVSEMTPRKLVELLGIVPGSTFTTSMGLPPSSERRISANDPPQGTRNLNGHGVFFYINPAVNVLIGGQYVSKTLAQNSPLTVEVLYAFNGVSADGNGNDQQINNLNDANRINKTDTTSLTAGSFNATLAAPAVTMADLAPFTATWHASIGRSFAGVAA